MKTNLFLSVSIGLLFSVSLAAQPAIKWQKTYGGSSDEYSVKTVQLKNGNYVFGAYSKSTVSGNVTAINNGGYDYWVIITDSAGKELKQVMLGGKQDDDLASIAATADGGFILAGTSSSPANGNKTSDVPGNENWIVKLDAAANVQWQQSISYSYGQLECISTTKDGGYVLTGIANNDYWLARLNASGTLTSSKTLGGSGYDIGYWVEQATDGGFILSGYSDSDSSGDKSENQQGNGDYWIVKTDSLGNRQWDKTMGGATVEYYRQEIHPTTDGGFIFGGSSDSPASPDKKKSSEGFDYWIIKFNSKGKVVLDYTINVSNEEYLGSLKQTADGGFIIAGGSDSPISGIKTESNRGAQDFWIIRFDKYGNKLWDKTIGGTSGADLAEGVFETPQGDYVLIGDTNSGRNGDKTDGRYGKQDIWLMKLGHEYVANSRETNVVTVTDRLQPSSFSVYPMPVHTILQVQTKATGIVILMDGSGKPLLQKTITGSGSFNVNSLPAGDYYLKNMTTGETKKVVKN